MSADFNCLVVEDSPIMRQLLVFALSRDADGVNLVAGSPRAVDEERAREIARAVNGRAEVIGVVAGGTIEALVALRDRVEVDALQLHGDELPETLAALLPRAYKALRIGGAADAARASTFGGARILVDAKVKGALGGTGATFDWSLVTALARARDLILAGGLRPDNVQGAIRAVRPFGVDSASGVEVPGHPPAKDLVKVRAFIAAARTDR
jgi:phosphoribosylanthranilate isomerase